MADLITMLSAVAGQQGEEVDEDFNQTVLLLHGDGTNGAQNNTFLDSSTNNFTITRNGNTTQGTFSPFSLSDGYWSNYFDGTDDYLSVADNAVLRPGAGAFTLEAWIYRNASGAAHTVYAKGGASTGIVFQVTSGNVLRFTHTTTNIDSTGTVAANAWVHVAVVREGTGTNQTKLYINGVQDGQGTVSTDFTQTEEVRIGTNRGATEDFAGYISNVRFVKGSALYTAGFTPSTVPLTTTSQGAVSSEVELLTCQSNRFVDNSTNAFAITRNGDVRVTPFSPFAPTAAYSAGTNGGSGYFDGNGDVLSASSNAAFGFGTGNFCVEFWIYPTALTTARGLYATSDTLGFYLYTNTTNKVVVRSWATADLITSNDAVLVNTWTHIAVCRSGTTLSLYINGSRTAGGTATNSTNFAQAALYIGAEVNSFYYAGYIAGLIAVKGSAVYDPTQTTIVVPTVPPTAITNTSLLLNFTNAGIIDNTGKNVLETVGNAQIDTAVKKYGTGSLEFDGTGDWLLMPSTPDLNLGTGNATIECWLYITAAIQDYRMIVSENTTLNYVCLRGGGTGGRIEINVAGTAFTIDLNNSISQNTWHHLAVVRSGSTFTAYVDGSSLGTGTSSAAWNYSTNGTLVGRFGGVTAYEWPGYIDDLRITKGVARYTANFTAPTKAFPDL